MRTLEARSRTRTNGATMTRTMNLVARLGHRIGKPPGWERVVRLFSSPERCRTLPELRVVRDGTIFGAQPGTLIGWHVAFSGTYEPELRKVFRAVLKPRRGRGGRRRERRMAHAADGAPGRRQGQGARGLAESLGACAAGGAPARKPDRPRRRGRLRALGRIVVAPLAMLVYVYILRGGILDGWRGLYYALQRTYAELALSLELLDRRLRRTSR
jgi:hypothetical protein